MLTPNIAPTTSSSTHASSEYPNTQKPKPKRSFVEKIMSAIFDGPSGTGASKDDRDLGEKYEEDRLDDFPRTKDEEKVR